MRCIFDTNTLISAVLFNNSIPGKALKYALSHGNIIISLETLEELVEVISRKKFDKYLSIEERQEFIDSLLFNTELIDVTHNLKICRDPDDDKFLNLAISGKANYIVTGDEDLLVISSYNNTRIVNAKDFLNIFEY